MLMHLLPKLHVIQWRREMHERELSSIHTRGCCRCRWLIDKGHIMASCEAGALVAQNPCNSVEATNERASALSTTY